jgi:hypothetical protein
LAILAADLTSGRTRLMQPTQAQAAKLCGVSLHYVNAAARLTLAQRVQIERGKLSLSQLVNNNRNQKSSDEAIDRYIVAVGADRVWDRLDQLTAPAPVVEAAE